MPIAAFGPTATQFYDPNRFIDYEDRGVRQQAHQLRSVARRERRHADTRYFVSAFGRDEGGIVDNTYAKKYRLRVNLDQRLSDRFELQVGAEVLRTLSDRGLFGNDNSGNSIAYTLTKIPSLPRPQTATRTARGRSIRSTRPIRCRRSTMFKNEEGVWRNISTRATDVGHVDDGAQRVASSSATAAPTC